MEILFSFLRCIVHVAKFGQSRALKVSEDTIMGIMVSAPGNQQTRGSSNNKQTHSNKFFTSQNSGARPGTIAASSMQQGANLVARAVGFNVETLYEMGNLPVAGDGEVDFVADIRNQLGKKMELLEKQQDCDFKWATDVE